jgi:hypothetical protein
MKWFSKPLGKSLVLDITPSSIEAAVLSHGSTGEEAISSFRKEFLNFSSSDTKEIVLILRSVLEKVFTTYQGKHRGEAFDHVLVALPAPFFESSVVTRKIQDKKQFLFDEWSLKEVIKEEEKKLRESLGEGYEVFESKVVSATLNGYEVSLPISKHTNEAEVVILFNGAEANFLRAVENEIIRLWGVKRGISFQSFVSLFLTHIYRTNPNVSSAILLTMCGETTEALVTKRKHAQEVEVIPFGPMSLVGALGKEFDVTPVLADSYLDTYREGAFNQATTEDIDRIMEKMESWFKEEWDKVLKNGPKDIFLVVDDRYLPFMIEMVKNTSGGHVTALSSRIGTIGKISSSILNLK